MAKEPFCYTPNQTKLGFSLCTFNQKYIPKDSCIASNQIFLNIK